MKVRRTAAMTMVVALGLSACESDSESPGSAGLATLKVAAATSGALPDADGYQVTLADRLGSELGANAEWSVGVVAARTYTVQLSNVAANCTVAGDNPRTIAVEPGQQLTVTFAVACTASVRVLTETTGIDADATGFLVAIGTDAQARVPTSGSTVVSSSADGTLPLRIADVAANCTPDPANPATVSVTQPVTDVTLRFSCIRATGEVVVTLSTQSWSGECDNLTVLMDDQRLPLIAGKATYFKDVPMGPQVVTIELIEGCSTEGDGTRTVSVSPLLTSGVHFEVWGVF